MAKDKAKVGEVILQNVRLSFADAIFKPKKVGDDENSEPRYSSSFLLDPNTASGRANIAAVEDAIYDAKDAKWGDDPPKLKPSKICLRDGDDEDWDGYAGMMYVAAAKPGNSVPPQVVHSKKDSMGQYIRLRPEDGKPYSGCYVNAVVRVWAQDNKFGKRINASLEAIQFVGDGEAFGAAPVDPDEKFAGLGGRNRDEEERPRRSRDRDEEEERPRRRDPDEEERPRRSRDRDEEEERPRRRRDPDEEERPRRSRDHDEEEERPRRRRDPDED